MFRFVEPKRRIAHHKKVVDFTRTFRHFNASSLAPIEGANSDVRERE